MVTSSLGDLPYVRKIKHPFNIRFEPDKKTTFQNYYLLFENPSPKNSCFKINWTKHPTHRPFQNQNQLHNPPAHKIKIPVHTPTNDQNTPKLKQTDRSCSLFIFIHSFHRCQFNTLTKYDSFEVCHSVSGGRMPRALWGTTWLGYDLTWVRVNLGTRWPGYELTWV